MEEEDRSGKKDNHLTIGTIGEDAACVFYTKRGFRILERNFRKPYGEIDIVAHKGDMLYFIEVKSVSCKTFKGMSAQSYIAAENVHHNKRKRLQRVIQVYLLQKGYEGEWQCDVALVFVNTTSRRSRIELLEDVIL